MPGITATPPNSAENEAPGTLVSLLRCGIDMSRRDKHEGKTEAVSRIGVGSRGPKAAVIVVGGSGGMSERYREVVEERGLELRHFENRVPSGTRRILGKVAAVVVMVGMVSHALRDQAKSLVGDDAPVVYLRSASVSALRGAVAALDADGDVSSASSRA